MNDVATTIVGFLSFAIIVRLLTPTEVGVMAILLLVLDLSQTVVDLGLPSALNKFVAQSDRSTGAYLIRTALRLVVLCSFVAGAVTVFLSAKLSQSFSGTMMYASAFAVLGIAVISAGVYDSLTGILMGGGRVKELATLDAARFFLQQILATGLVVLGWGLVGVMTGWAIGYTLFALGGYLIAYRASRVTKSKVSLRGLLRFSGPLYARDFVGFAYTWVDRALLLLFVPLSQLGIYNVAFVGFGILASTPGAIAASLFPHYSKLSTRSSKKLEDAVWSASRYIALIVSPLALGLAALAPTVLRILGGATYQTGAVALAILSILLFVTLSSYSLGAILVALNRPAQQAIITLVGASISLMFGVVLIPRLGINGSAIARGSGMVVGLIVTAWFVRRSIALKFDLATIWKTAVAASIMALIVLTMEVSLKSVFLVPAYVLIGAFVYILVLRFENAVNQADIRLFKAFAGESLAGVVDRLGAFLTR